MNLTWLATGFALAMLCGAAPRVPIASPATVPVKAQPTPRAVMFFGDAMIFYDAAGIELDCTRDIIQGHANPWADESYHSARCNY